ncbi:MAG: hypothetical protein QOF18_1687, partial [Frankiaceae bacterium]|nr:hypothetical protein [Frankiaceae bacterium]
MRVSVDRPEIDREICPCDGDALTMISAPDEDHPDTTRYDFPDMSRWVFCLIAQDG